MKELQRPGFIFWGAISGIIGTLAYVAAISVPLNELLLFCLAMAWPVLSLFFVFALYSYISWDHQSAANQLSLLFGCLGFMIVVCMLSIQLAIGIGMEDLRLTGAGDETVLTLIHSSLRLVDQGLDVAWDIFIGISLIFLAVAIRRHPEFGVWWTLPLAILGILIIVLNVATFPYPPNTRGLFDIGPAVGLFIIILASRLLWISRKLIKSGNT